MGAAAAPIGVAAVGAAAQGLGAALQDDPRQAGIVRLQPELENKQLEIISQAIADAQRERERALAISQTLEDRARAQQAVAQGLVPRAEALSAITRQNEELAQRFGADITRTLDQLSSDTLGALNLDVEKDIRSQIQKELGQPLQEFKDPTVERELSEGRQRLEEQLMRTLGPGYANSDQGRRAMQMFDQSAVELRSRTSRESRNENVTRLGQFAQIAGSTKQSQLAARGSILNTGQLLFQGRETTQDRLGQGIYAENAALDQLRQASALGQQAATIGQQPFGLLQQFGQQELSRDITRGIERGDFGNIGFNDFVTDSEARRRKVETQGNAITQQISQNNIPSGYVRGGFTPNNEYSLFNPTTNNQVLIDPLTGRPRQRSYGSLF